MPWAPPALCQVQLDTVWLGGLQTQLGVIRLGGLGTVRLVGRYGLQAASPAFPRGPHMKWEQTCLYQACVWDIGSLLVVSSHAGDTWGHKAPQHTRSPFHREQ